MQFIYEDLCENTALLGKYQGFGHSILAPRGVCDSHPMKNGTSRVLVHTFHQKKMESIFFLFKLHMKTSAKIPYYLANIKGSDTQSLPPEERVTLIQRKMARMEFLYIPYILAIEGEDPPTPCTLLDPSK